MGAHWALENREVTFQKCQARTAYFFLLDSIFKIYGPMELTIGGQKKIWDLGFEFFLIYGLWSIPIHI